MARGARARPATRGNAGAGAPISSILALVSVIKRSLFTGVNETNCLILFSEGKSLVAVQVDVMCEIVLNKVFYICFFLLKEVN